LARTRDKNRKNGGNDHENLTNLLDQINRTLIDLMLEDPQISQIELAKKLNMSQSSVALRLEKLRKSGLIETMVGVNLPKLGLKMGRVDLSCTQVDKVLDWAKKCPLFINSTLGIGGDNISLFLVAEDVEMFQYLVEHHIRKLRGVMNCNFNTVLRWAKEDPVSLPLMVKKTAMPPCGIMPYCPRCPGNPNYDGKIWADREDRHRT
jgi:Lrp/AsnC family leucine-responsive transcriptional regulator